MNLRRLISCKLTILLLVLPLAALTAPGRYPKNDRRSHRFRRSEPSQDNAEGGKDVKMLKVSEETTFSSEDNQAWYPVQEVGNDYAYSDEVSRTTTPKPETTAIAPVEKENPNNTPPENTTGAEEQNSKCANGGNAANFNSDEELIKSLKEVIRKWDRIVAEIQPQLDSSQITSNKEKEPESQENHTGNETTSITSVSDSKNNSLTEEVHNAETSETPHEKEEIVVSTASAVEYIPNKNDTLDQKDLGAEVDNHLKDSSSVEMINMEQEIIEIEHENKDHSSEKSDNPLLPAHLEETIRQTNHTVTNHHHHVQEHAKQSPHDVNTNKTK